MAANTAAVEFDHPRDVQVSSGYLRSDDAFYVLAIRPLRLHRLDQVVYPGSSMVCWRGHDAGVAWLDPRGLARPQAALA